MKRVMTLVATMMISPVMAQTITSPGLIGPTACVGTGEVDTPLTGTISAVATTQVTLAYDARDNLYSSLRSTLGDGGATSFPLRYRVYNARTGSQTGSEGGFATINSGNPNLASGSAVSFSLSEKTPYYIAIYSTASGYGESRPLLRRCFMTGGTYTPSNESGQPGFVANTTSGCFSISPRTPQDVKNCLCGRSEHSAYKSALGCADRL